MFHDHPSAEQLQAFLEGELPDREQRGFEEHLAGCARCAGEAETWRMLFEDLSGLSAHRPLEGFADRVMSGVRVPEPLPIAARVRSSLGAALPKAADRHVDETVLQSFLEGALPARQVASVETHLAACPSCSSEADGWLTLFQHLEGLERFAPAEGFAERVVSGVVLPEPRPLAARLKVALAGLFAPARADHPGLGRLQDFLEGALPTRQMARVETHLNACDACATEARAWHALLEELGRLASFAPREGFAERVIAGVSVGAVATAPAKAPLSAPSPARGFALAWGRVIATARRMVPHTRQAWAALSGIAVTPAVTAGLVLYAVFSHPTLTVGALLSFLWWQVTDLATAGWTSLATVAIESAQLFDVYALVAAAASAPLVVAAGVLAYSLASLLALRVLYKNLFANRSLDRGYAHVSAS